MPRFDRRAITPVLALICAAAHPASASAQTSETNAPAENDAFYCEERKLGYWFYCTKPKPAPKTEAAAPAPVPDAVTRMDAITAELRELKARAILEPTPANVTAYIRFQREQLDRASLFSDVWQRAIWQDPDLDYTLQRPVSTLAKRQWQGSRASERNGVMAGLSARYGLFYFFAQSCGACEVMSPIVRSVTSNWGITVRAISTDGGPSRHFPNYIVETNQRSKMGLEPKVTPAVVLWDALKGRPIPIGYGVMSADELQDRIYLLTQKEAGHDY
ncbi:conjugal transfer protein TraF [Sphingorhabdus pulchriflava]|uniref:Conjugal transfer protein TraF n=1 Tax=Sphingorhabdus pulchriflava TaxID=2292257 RepID=A0A371BJ51_9SPHN|nr:conjugal transfer protein TraF [Sphingorhabdus pulchriflava]RDV07403.1 conjugal transfer protein TraF [Sphingorhabdus pulchriflava]